MLLFGIAGTTPGDTPAAPAGTTTTRCEECQSFCQEMIESIASAIAAGNEDPGEVPEKCNTDPVCPEECS